MFGRRLPPPRPRPQTPVRGRGAERRETFDLRHGGRREECRPGPSRGKNSNPRSLPGRDLFYAVGAEINVNYGSSPSSPQRPPSHRAPTTTVTPQGSTAGGRGRAPSPDPGPVRHVSVARLIQLSKRALPRTDGRGTPPPSCPDPSSATPDPPPAGSPARPTGRPVDPCAAQGIPCRKHSLKRRRRGGSGD